MPELPEVETTRRGLLPHLVGRRIRGAVVRNANLRWPITRDLSRRLRGEELVAIRRRGKYLVFELRQPGCRAPLILVGHLGMTGRMYLAPRRAPLPKHAAVILDLGREWFVYEDPRYFGRLTLDTRAVSRLGPEPLGEDFTVAAFGAALTRSRQAIRSRRTTRG